MPQTIPNQSTIIRRRQSGGSNDRVVSNTEAQEFLFQIRELFKKLVSQRSVPEAGA
jgi:hypothetical protein